MAWERAKGELKSIQQAIYPGELDQEKRDDVDRFRKLLDEFIKTVDEEGLIDT